MMVVKKSTEQVHVGYYSIEVFVPNVPFSFFKRNTGIIREASSILRFRYSDTDIP